MHIHKKIILGITGGIAAYKSAELLRLLVKADCDVQVVMTEAACNFITPTTMQALSNKPVLTDLWSNTAGNGMPHIDISRSANAILIAPASADFIAKLIQGRADDLLSTLCLARDCPLLLAPAMNRQMWENPATQRNVKQCDADGILLFGPDSGEQACGEVGLGRMQEPELILSAVNTYFTPKLLAKKRIMVTAGATVEMIDPVRAITNLSSGKMGYAIAQAAADMGAEVTLISGASALELPKNIATIHAISGKQMYDAVMQNIQNQDIFISVAAVADYAPTITSTQKIKKSDDTLTINLKKNNDILSEVANLENPPFCVGFAAETQNLINTANEKRISKKLPMLVANLVGESMGQDEANITLIDGQGTHPLPRASKAILARQLLMHLSQLLTTTRISK